MTHRKPAGDVHELARALRAGQRLLGLDVGAKTIGVALSDAGRMIASPHSTIRRHRRFAEDAAALARLVADNEVGGFVIGLPINMDGSEGPRCQSVRQFAENLLARIDTLAAFWDERLSTVAAERTLLEADVSRKRRSEVIDKMAAALILQGALDAMARSGR
jgi:putative Holliday junction resolvase